MQYKGEQMSQNDPKNLNDFNQNTSSPPDEFQDVAINCIDCEQDFVWTSGEQHFYHDKKLQNPPKRCKACKQAKNDRLAAIADAQAAGIKQRIEVAVHCAKCGNYTTVPFYPSQGRPVYCRSCFLAMNPNLMENV